MSEPKLSLSINGSEKTCQSSQLQGHEGITVPIYAETNPKVSLNVNTNANLNVGRNDESCFDPYVDSCLNSSDTLSCMHLSEIMLPMPSNNRGYGLPLLALTSAVKGLPCFSLSFLAARVLVRTLFSSNSIRPSLYGCTTLGSATRLPVFLVSPTGNNGNRLNRTCN